MSLDCARTAVAPYDSKWTEKRTKVLDSLSNELDRAREGDLTGEITVKVEFARGGITKIRVGAERLEK